VILWSHFRWRCWRKH